MDTLSEKYKVEYLEWEDSQGNCSTSYAIILEADSKEEAERELVELKAQQGDVERSNARFNWLLAYHNSTVGTKGLQPLSLKCLDEEFLSYNH
jgi:hypothetical protein